jgi:DNA-binding transcriptional MocR family regulator
MPAEPIRRTIKLGPAAHELRRHVGPVAWVVLEEMLQRSTGHDDHIVAQVSIRALASSLGLAKDTVTRAVGRLRDLGVIDASQARSRSGVFEAGSYRLAVPAVCLSPAGPSQPSALSPAPRPSRAAAPSAPRSSSAARPSPSARRPSGQLSLLPEV